MRQVVSDDKCTVSLEGLRFVVKEDRDWGGKVTKHSIQVAYKGMQYTVEYGTDKEARDAMYDRIVKGLHRNGKDEQTVTVVSPSVALRN